MSRKVFSCREPSGNTAVKPRNKPEVTMQSKEYIREDLLV